MFYFTKIFLIFFILLEKVLDEKIHEYEIGRRHLARIMGEDPENFNQEKIDV